MMSNAMKKALDTARFYGIKVIPLSYPFRGRPGYKKLAGLPDPRECNRYYFVPKENAIIVPPWVL